MKVCVEHIAMNKCSFYLYFVCSFTHILLLAHYYKFTFWNWINSKPRELDSKTFGHHVHKNTEHTYDKQHCCVGRQLGRFWCCENRPLCQHSMLPALLDLCQKVPINEQIFRNIQHNLYLCVLDEDIFVSYKKHKCYCQKQATQPMQSQPVGVV